MDHGKHSHDQHGHNAISDSTIPPKPLAHTENGKLNGQIPHSQNHQHNHPHQHNHIHGHHGNVGGHNMKMWFHGGCREVILFDFWTIDSYSGLIFSCILVFLVAVLYETLKWFRVYFEMWTTTTSRNAQNWNDNALVLSDLSQKCHSSLECCSIVKANKSSGQQSKNAGTEGAKLIQKTCENCVDEHNDSSSPSPIPNTESSTAVASIKLDGSTVKTSNPVIPSSHSGPSLFLPGADIGSTLAGETVYAPTTTPAIYSRAGFGKDEKTTGWGQNVVGNVAGVAVLTFSDRIGKAIIRRRATLSQPASHLIETLLYCIQLLLAYWLMLIAMTFNIWLTMAVIGGAGLGHWLGSSGGPLHRLAPPPPKKCACTTERVEELLAEDACH